MEVSSFSLPNTRIKIIQLNLKLVVASHDGNTKKEAFSVSKFVSNEFYSTERAAKRFERLLSAFRTLYPAVFR